MKPTLEFDPQNPYPLIDLASVPYEVQKEHAREVDDWLGFQVERVESSLERQNPPRDKIREEWIGLPPQSLQTPYVELRRMLEEVQNVGALPPGARVVDVGAAYGRLGFVVQAHAPQARFTGLEVSPARVLEGQRVYREQRLQNSELIEMNVLTQALPEAQVYFTYDFGSMKSIEALLEKLKIQASRGPLTVVGRGRATRDQIERKHPWLSQVERARHLGNFSIYRTG